MANEYAMDQSCDLTVIDDEKEKYPREYAIGLQKLSPHMKSFNKAIRQLKETGKLEELKRRYWNTKCLSNSLNAKLVNNSMNTKLDNNSTNSKLNFITTLGFILYALIYFVLFH